MKNEANLDLKWVISEMKYAVDAVELEFRLIMKWKMVQLSGYKWCEILLFR